MDFSRECGRCHIPSSVTQIALHPRIRQTTFMSIYPPIVALLVTVFVTTLILCSKLGKTVQDIPNERSLHTKAVPRTGGIGLLVGIVAGWTSMAASLEWWLVLPTIGLFMVSLLDDIHSLSVKQRLLIHLIAVAILVTGSGVALQNGWLIAAAVVLSTVWMTNLYNFMDGSDGLAGGMALFGFTSYGIAALLARDDALAFSALTIAAAAFGFLFFNFHPAKIFMGDAGSIPLGFLAAATGLWGWQRGDWPVWFPLLVFSPFIVDATVTLAKRALRGMKITEAHREHYYQRAIQMGAGHRNVALFEYVLMLLAGISAICFREQGFPWQVLLAWGGIYSVCMIKVDSRWNKLDRASL